MPFCVTRHFFECPLRQRLAELLAIWLVRLEKAFRQQHLDDTDMIAEYVQDDQAVLLALEVQALAFT